MWNEATIKKESDENKAFRLQQNSGLTSPILNQSPHYDCMVHMKMLFSASIILNYTMNDVSNFQIILNRLLRIKFVWFSMYILRFPQTTFCCCCCYFCVIFLIDLKFIQNGFSTMCWWFHEFTYGNFIAEIKFSLFIFIFIAYWMLLIACRNLKMRFILCFVFSIFFIRRQLGSAENFLYFYHIRRANGGFYPFF